MSELLGWYGYEKVDSGCTQDLNLDHFSPLSNIKKPNPRRYKDVKNIKNNILINSKKLIKNTNSNTTDSISIIPSNKNDKFFMEHLSTINTTSPRIPDNGDSASDTPGNIFNNLTAR